MASLQQQLWDGASGGDLIKVKQAIAAGVNIDAGDPNYVSGLTGVVRQLLVAGVGRVSDRDGCPRQGSWSWVVDAKDPRIDSPRPLPSRSRSTSSRRAPPPTRRSTRAPLTHFMSTHGAGWLHGAHAGRI